MKHSDHLDVYRVGFGHDLYELRICLRLHEWRSARYRVLHWMRTGLTRRSWWGLWQAEWPECRRAVRGLTRRGTLRKAQRRMAAR